MATKIPIMKHRHFFETLTFYILANNADIVLKFIPDTRRYMPNLHRNPDLQWSRSPHVPIGLIRYQYNSKKDEGKCSIF